MAIKNLGPFSGSVTPPEDWLRIVVTLLFSLALVLLVGWFFYQASVLNDKADIAWTRVKEAFQDGLPPLVGVLGTVIGFYFGERKR